MVIQKCNYRQVYLSAASIHKITYYIAEGMMAKFGPSVGLIGSVELASVGGGYCSVKVEIGYLNTESLLFLKLR